MLERCGLRLEADNFLVGYGDGRDGNGYGDKGRPTTRAQEAEHIDQEGQNQEHGKAEIILLHDGVTGLHGRPEIHALVHDEQVGEF